MKVNLLVSKLELEPSS